MKNVIELAKQARLGAVLTHQGGFERVFIEGADWHDELELFATLVRNNALDEAAAWLNSYDGNLNSRREEAIRNLKETT